ncbi:MAG TPA: ATP-binding protein [Burkholderiales bacterium]|nr:ATP-binding protein [Burkholderiales bacterium]
MTPHSSAEPVPLEWHRSPLPSMPQRVEDTGLDFSFLVELLAKVLYVRGQLRLPDLGAHVKLPPGVLEPLLTFMRTERLCEMVRRGETEGAMAYNLTDLGRSRAQDFLQRSQYAGPAPVNLKAYVSQVEKQSIVDMGVTRQKLNQAFSGIVIKEQLLNQFGAAMNSGRAIFVYGPAGSGKTYIAERLVGLLSGGVAIPYAIEVDNEVIQVFDPVVHEPVAVQGSKPSVLDRGRSDDDRWVLCRRPVVLTGAELTLAMVDLEFDHKARFYQAPPQVKANNGLFIVDDLGRQLVSPQDLMNRWIVPLDRRVDYLALHTGKKFQIPFDVIVVFSSNIQPSKLADEAFLRRLGYKIFVGPLDETEYRAIFMQVCAQTRIAFAEDGYRYVLEELHGKNGKPLLACHPRDILCQVRDIARFNGVPPELSQKLLTWAWDNYFAHD